LRHGEPRRLRQEEARVRAAHLLLRAPERPFRPAGLPAYFDRKTFSWKRPTCRGTPPAARRVLMKRVIAALNMPRRIPDFIHHARFIADCLASDPVYAGSTPPLNVFEAHLDM